MKFSQFIELDDTLAKNNKSIDELTETLQNKDFSDNQILEFFGINKALLSWGVKGILATRLEKQAAVVEEDMKAAIKKSINKITKSTEKMYDQIAEFKKANKEVPKEYVDQVLKLESKVVNMINTSIDKLTKIKSDHVIERIDQSKKLKPSAKVALTYQWEKLMIDAKVNAMTYLIDNKVIKHDATINKIKEAAKVEDARLQDKAKNEINPKIQDLKKKEAAGGGEKEETEGEKKGTEI